MSALAFVLVALLIDRIRISLFKLMKIDLLADHIADLIDRFVALIESLSTNVFISDNEK